MGLKKAIIFITILCICSIGYAEVKRLAPDSKRDANKKISESFINDLTWQQVDDYIDNNVTDLASAKVYIKKLSKVVYYLLKNSGLQ